MKIAKTIILNTFLFTFFISCTTTKQPQQSQDYVLGTLTFKLHDNHSLNIHVNEDKSVDIREFPFLKKLIKPYGITQVARPYDLFDDTKLLQTFTISYTKTEKTDAFINELKSISIIEYVEKVPIKRKLNH